MGQEEIEGRMRRAIAVAIHRGNARMVKTGRSEAKESFTQGWLQRRRMGVREKGGEGRRRNGIRGERLSPLRGETLTSEV